jgi:hypothetical protein
LLARSTFGTGLAAPSVLLAALSCLYLLGVFAGPNFVIFGGSAEAVLFLSDLIATFEFYFDSIGFTDFGATFLELDLTVELLT